MEKDIRWEQRFSNYKSALSQLQKFITKGDLNELEEQGLIQAFEFTHELAWNVMKDYIKYRGAINLIGSKDATREAFQAGLITDGDEWMDMIKSRNISSHAYHEAAVKKIKDKVFNSYFKLFIDFRDKMQTLVK